MKSLGCIMSETKHQSGCAGKEAFMENRKRIVTIGRQYGSGGSEVGKKLAEKLGVHCYERILRITFSVFSLR